MCTETFALKEIVGIETYHKFICCAFDDSRYFGATEGACKKVHLNVLPSIALESMQALPVPLVDGKL